MKSSVRNPNRTKDNVISVVLDQVAKKAPDIGALLQSYVTKQSV